MPVAALAADWGAIGAVSSITSAAQGGYDASGWCTANFGGSDAVDSNNIRKCISLAEKPGTEKPGTA